MIRIVLIALLAVAVWAVALGVWRYARTREIDWTGVAGVIGFVALAFWLRHATGMG